MTVWRFPHTPTILLRTLIATGTGRTALHLPLAVFDADVAHVHTLDNVDKVFGDVFRVITGAFECTCGPHEVERPADRLWVFHHDVRQAAHDRLIFFIGTDIRTFDFE